MNTIVILDGIIQRMYFDPETEIVERYGKVVLRIDDKYNADEYVADTITWIGRMLDNPAFNDVQSVFDVRNTNVIERDEPLPE